MNDKECTRGVKNILRKNGAKRIMECGHPIAANATRTLAARNRKVAMELHLMAYPDKQRNGKE